MNRYYQKKTDIINIFDNIAPIYDRLIYVDSENYEKRLVSFLTSQFNNRLAKKVINLLDVGCGTGIPAIGLSKKGINVTAIDISEKMIETIRKKSYKSNLKILKEDWDNLTNNLFDIKFDVILFRGGNLELCVNYESMIKLFNKFYVLLNDAGLIYLTIRNWGKIFSRIKNNKYEYASTFPILQNKKIYTSIINYKYIKKSLRTKIFILETSASGITNSYLGKYAFPIVTEEKLYSIINKTQFTKVERIKDFTEYIMRNEHKCFFIYK